MDFPLLATKVRIPPLSHHTIYRTRLINALENGIPRYKLILISAPAGYGKTTLLAQWAKASSLSTAWLALEEADNNFERFFRYLLTSWNRVQPGVMNSPLGMLLGAAAPEKEAVLTAFINAIDNAVDPLVFVLDDAHVIDEPEIYEALAFLLDHLSPDVHFVLAGRDNPPLPLARYRARRELLALDVGELHFRLQESAEFLNEKMGLDLAPDAVELVQSQTEGWAAGLQLLALSLQKRLTASEGLRVNGRHRFIADYLRQDVLAPLPDALQRFLMQTSILERLYAPLCEAVVQREGAQQTLETAERANLFLLPLDDRREWFRYHPLFAGFLREELQRRRPEEVAGLHRRAARWYLERALPELAFHHAAAGQDVDLTRQIFEQYTQQKLISGEFRLIQQWLDALPPAWRADYLLFDLVQTGLLLFTGRMDDCVRTIEELERRAAFAEGEKLRRQMAQVRAVRCSIACFQNDLAQAEYFAAEAFQELSDEDAFFRAIILGSLGDTYRRNGRWRNAQKCYLELLDFIHAPESGVLAVHVFGALADLELRQGGLRRAAGYWRRALTLMQQGQAWGRLPLPLTGWVYIRLGELHYEWNELQQAWDYLSPGLERAELGGDLRAMIAGCLLAGRLKLTEGDIDAAETYLAQARAHVEGARFAHWLSRFERFQLEVWLAQDRLRTAVHWADEMLQSGELAERPESEVAQLALVRVLIVKGDKPALRHALTLLDRLRQAAEAAGQTGVVVEAWALTALAHWRNSNEAGAMTALAQALRLAGPEGYVRLFVDMGLPMARLLQQAHARDVMPDYVATLLAACDASLSTAASQTVPDPLTPREEEILALLAAGLTNVEIADELVISPGTVKKHASNIYGKLDVNGRTEAAARARELGLLG